MSDPDSRIILARQSLTGFVCGLLGLVPVLGLIPAVYAIFCWFRFRRRYPNEWNPALPYLRWGAVFGFIGVAVLVCAVLALVLSFILGDSSLSDFSSGDGT